MMQCYTKGALSQMLQEIKCSENQTQGRMVSSPTAESFGISAQIGSGVVRGGPEARFHEGCTRLAPGFHEVLRGLRGGASTKKEHCMLLGMSPELLCFRLGQ